MCPGGMSIYGLTSVSYPNKTPTQSLCLIQHHHLNLTCSSHDVAAKMSTLSINNFTSWDVSNSKSFY